jgi:cell division protein FtsZ
MAKQVDALLIINNEKFRSIYPDLDMPETCAKVDDMAANTVKDIAEIITVQGHTCNDFADVYAVMENSGLTIMWTEYAEGENKHCFIIN